MLLDYQDCIREYANPYGIKQAVQKRRLYRIERGIYADVPYVSEPAILQKKYAKAIFTMKSAFFYHGMTTTIPELYHLATPSKAARLKDPRIKQYFVPEKLFSLGQVPWEQEGAQIRIYDKERMLIELLRYKNSLPYDYYKEILRNYRNILETLDIERIENYATIFPRSETIWKRLEEEVF